MSDLSKVKLIIFDLDGTLVDAYPAIISSFNFAMQQFKLPVQNGMVIRRAVGWGDKNLLKPFVGKESLVKVLSAYRRHHEGALKKKTRFLPNAKNLLKQLKWQKYSLALASNRPTKFSLIILESLGIKKYFDYILCADKLKSGKGKPDPQILLKILEKLSVRSHEALYVGDMAIDVMAGRRAKIRTVAVTTGSSRKSELLNERPFKVIGRLSSLSSVLNHRNGKNKHE